MSKVSHIFIWDLGIRSFHWLLVIAIINAYLSIEVFDAPLWHAYSGWVIACLLIFRILWALIVWPLYANLVTMWHSLVGVIPYLPHLFKRSGTQYLGHNPLGMVAIAIIILLITILLITGATMAEEGIIGALNQFVSLAIADISSEVHEFAGEVLQIIIFIHIAGIIFYTFYKRQKLVSAMVYGNKEISNHNTIVDNAGPQPQTVSYKIKALIVLVLTAIIAGLLLQVWVESIF